MRRKVVFANANPGQGLDHPHITSIGSNVG